LKTKTSQSQLLVAGVDEVGRGPWAGPLVACAYIEIKVTRNVKITDSKKLSKLQRENAFSKLIKNGIVGIGRVEPKEIDKLGLIKANNLAFQRAITNLKIKPDFIMIDGKDRIFPETTQNIPHKSIIHGDSLVRAISCASIIAKVTRDRLMEEFSYKYPGYAFEKNMGYGTKTHIQALAKYGPSRIHRMSYKPVKALSGKFKKR
jgi:ribonuclease HII